MRFLLILIPFLFIGSKAFYVLDKPTQNLPSPETSYIVGPNDGIGMGNVIKEYISANFDQNKSIRTIRANSKNDYNCCKCEVCTDPSTKQLYGNIVITDTHHCDSPQSIFEFIGYKYAEVEKMLKLLLIDGDYYKWSENSYDIIDFEEDVYSGFVEIEDDGDRIIVIIGVDVCQI